MNVNQISQGIKTLNNRIDEALNRSASATLNSHRGLSASLGAAPQQYVEANKATPYSPHSANDSGSTDPFRTTKLSLFMVLSQVTCQFRIIAKVSCQFRIITKISCQFRIITKVSCRFRIITKVSYLLKIIFNPTSFLSDINTLFKKLEVPLTDTNHT